LGENLCFEHGRKADNDYGVRIECRLFRIPKTNRILPRPKDKAAVRIGLDGNLGILRKGKEFLVEGNQISKQGRSDFHVA
jgi:hypothetical protein